jgi:chemotaxis protein histidine kinase CheA
MSRAVLVIICDFLLISLLSLASFDQKAGARSQSSEDVGVEVQAVQDMLDTLKQVLEQEQVARTQLSANLDQTEAALQQRQRDLAAREAQLKKLEATVREAEERASRIDQERVRLQQQQEESQTALAALQAQEVQARDRIGALQAQLDQVRQEANVSQAKVQVMETELLSRREEARQMQTQISKLDQANRETAAVKERLAVDLSSARTEAAVVREQLGQTITQVESLATEKAQLQATTATLAEGTRAIAREVQAQRSYSPNSIFGEFLSNRVELAFQAQRSGIFGIGVKNDDQNQTVLFTSGNGVFALCHIGGTPLPQVGGGSDWDALTATIRRGSASAALSQLWLLWSDPRVVVLPVPAETVSALGAQVYPLAADPAKFQEAVLVGSHEGYYGEVQFRIEPPLTRYVRMQTRPLGKVFGKFSPSRGDLVFSKHGELLGIMVNPSYCLLIEAVQPTRTIRLGDKLGNQRTSRIGAEIAGRIQGLPYKLQ